nr:hypothetical protein CFP56_40010 [Quercus suber]
MIHLTTSIVIRGDKWLPRTSASKVVSPASILHQGSWVSDLIDHETHTWRKELISQEFLSHEASLIIAYKLLASSDRAVQPTSSSSSRGKALWKDTEDTTHALWGCNSLSAIWSSHDGLKKMVRFNFGVFFDLLEVVFQRPSSVDVDVLAMMFWLIWNNRNAKRCGGAIIENHLIQSKAERMINELKSAHVIHRKPSDAVTRATINPQQNPESSTSIRAAPEPLPGRAVPSSSQQPPCDAWAVDGGSGDRGEAARGAPERLGLLEARGDPRISPIRAAPELPPGRAVPPLSQQPLCDAWAVDGGSGDRGEAARGAPKRHPMIDPRISPLTDPGIP